MTRPAEATKTATGTGTAARMERVLIANGPGANVDTAGFEQFCRTWAQPLGLEVQAVACDSEDALARALESASAFDGLIVNADGCERASALEPALRHGGAPSVAVSLAATGLPSTRVEGPVRHIRGRGIDGYRWALRHLVHRTSWPFETIAYGDAQEQVGDLRRPTGPGLPPVVVLLHGGGWKKHWQRDIMEGAAIDLCRRGYATWNTEFRRVGSEGGGWPGTFDDVAAAIEALSNIGRDRPLDLSRVLFLGHSSGGQLALWAAARSARPDALVVPATVASLAGVVDLVESARRGLIGGENAAAGLLGGLPDRVPERYAQTSPAHLLPIGVRQLLVQGLRDYIPDLVDLNRAYAARARSAGDDVELLELPDADHLGVIDVPSAAWDQVAAALEMALPAGHRGRGS